MNIYIYTYAYIYAHIYRACVCSRATVGGVDAGSGGCQRVFQESPPKRQERRRFQRRRVGFQEVNKLNELRWVVEGGGVRGCQDVGHVDLYGVATISMLFEIISLFCKRAL